MAETCKICGDSEPFHVHNGPHRIENYFTVGRGMTEMEAAREWQRKAKKAEAALRESLEQKLLREVKEVYGPLAEIVVNREEPNGERLR